jgi:hypothetical protein
MRFSTALLLIPVALLSLGATDCDQFQEVTVPATDSKPPLAVGSAYRGNQEALMHSWERDGGTLYRHQGPPTDLLVAVASSIDEGGAKRVRMTWTMQSECCRLSGGAWSACELVAPYAGTLEDQQQGAVGSRVSSGVYVAQPIGDTTQCPAGKRTRRRTVDFRVHAWDFRGNQSASGPHRIIHDITPG